MPHCKLGVGQPFGLVCLYLPETSFKLVLVAGHKGLGVLDKTRSAKLCLSWSEYMLYPSLDVPIIRSSELPGSNISAVNPHLDGPGKAGVLWKPS